jgi:hypothetical protein
VPCSLVWKLSGDYQGRGLGSFVLSQVITRAIDFYLHRYLDADIVFDGSSRRRQRQDTIGQGVPTSLQEPSIDDPLVANQTRYREKAKN